MRIVLAALGTVFLPIILIVESALLLYQGWTYWKYDLDREIKESGGLWSERLRGLCVQEPRSVLGGFVSAAASGTAVVGFWTVAAILYGVAIAIVWRNPPISP